VKGDRLVHRSPLHTSIIDLSNETITSIDQPKKTYSVITFAEMKQAMEQMSEKMQQQQQKKGGDQADMKFKVSANATGKKKAVNGFDSSEMLLTMQMEGTDKKSGQSAAMVVFADSWIAPSVPGYNEVREFYKRWPRRSRGRRAAQHVHEPARHYSSMSEVSKESAKLDGMPVFQT